MRRFKFVATKRTWRAEKKMSNYKLGKNGQGGKRYANQNP